ncbi:hypothetical protein ADUPG1_010742, partial [Aduncisulcus paluster]
MNINAMISERAGATIRTVAQCDSSIQSLAVSPNGQFIALKVLESHSLTIVERMTLDEYEFRRETMWKEEKGVEEGQGSGRIKGRKRKKSSGEGSQSSPDHPARGRRSRETYGEMIEKPVTPRQIDDGMSQLTQEDEEIYEDSSIGVDEKAKSKKQGQKKRKDQGFDQNVTSFLWPEMECSWPIAVKTRWEKTSYVSRWKRSQSQDVTSPMLIPIISFIDDSLILVGQRKNLFDIYEYKKSSHVHVPTSPSAVPGPRSPIRHSLDVAPGEEIVGSLGECRGDGSQMSQLSSQTQHRSLSDSIVVRSSSYSSSSSSSSTSSSASSGYSGAGGSSKRWTATDMSITLPSPIRHSLDVAPGEEIVGSLGECRGDGSQMSQLSSQTQHRSLSDSIVVRSSSYSSSSSSSSTSSSASSGYSGAGGSSKRWTATDMSITLPFSALSYCACSPDCQLFAPSDLVSSGHSQPSMSQSLISIIMEDGTIVIVDSFGDCKDILKDVRFRAANCISLSNDGRLFAIVSQQIAWLWVGNAFQDSLSFLSSEMSIHEALFSSGHGWKKVASGGCRSCSFTFNGFLIVAHAHKLSVYSPSTDNIVFTFSDITLLSVTFLKCIGNRIVIANLDRILVLKVSDEGIISYEGHIGMPSEVLCLESGMGGVIAGLSSGGVYEILL